MNINDIKVGETYNVQLHFREIDPDGKLWISEADEGNIIKLTFDGAYISTRHLLFSNDLISPLPKYDPCRLFKKGDRVRVVTWNGRCYHDAGKHLLGAYYEVAEDEKANNLIKVFHDSTELRFDPAYLELVTPVEELEPYKVIKGFTHSNDFSICKKYATEWRAVKSFWYHNEEDEDCNHADTYSEQSAKEAAQAECDRMNAEYRKEQNNV